MNYTEKIKQFLKTELEPSDHAYRCFNTGGVEVETGEFLYALVRLMKPRSVLETGTHKGISAAYMAGAMADNHAQGMTHTQRVDTIEFIKENHDDAGRLFRELGLMEYISQYLGESLKFEAMGEYDLILLDTEPQIRFEELEKFFPHLKAGGTMLIHDLHPHMHQIENKEHGFAWPYGKIPQGMMRLLKNKNLVPVHFRTPRGLTMFYKPGAEDYKEYLNEKAK